MYTSDTGDDWIVTADGRPIRGGPYSEKQARGLAAMQNSMETTGRKFDVRKVDA